MKIELIIKGEIEGKQFVEIQKILHELESKLQWFKTSVVLEELKQK